MMRLAEGLSLPVPGQNLLSVALVLIAEGINTDQVNQVNCVRLFVYIPLHTMADTFILCYPAHTLSLPSAIVL